MVKGEKIAINSSLKIIFENISLIISPQLKNNKVQPPFNVS